jgi:hypothetical protein
MLNKTISILLILICISCAKEEESGDLTSSAAVSVAFTIDPSGTSISGANGNTYSITFATSGTTETNNDAKVMADTGSGFVDIGTCTNLAVSATCSWSVPNINIIDAKLKIELTLSGKTYSPTTSDFIIDSIPPTISALTLNSGAVSTTDRNIVIDMTAADASNNITHYCIRLGNTSKPALNSTCWVPVTNTQTLSLNSTAYQLSLVSGEYHAYAFVKDEAGNVSDISNAGTGTLNQDYATIDFILGTPPTINNVLVSEVANPDNPPSAVQKTFTGPSSVYIKWTASDVEGMDATPITLYYTTDDITYSEITSGLLNASNSGCTINDTTLADDSATGCYIWNSGSTPTGYFKIRVKALDSSGQISLTSSDSMNVSSIKFIAGNTDPGLGASAASAVFFPTDVSNATPDNGHMLIATNGDFYFKDKSRGLLKVKASDGLQNLFIAKDTSIDLTDVAQSGNITSATRLKSPQYIALDFEGNILVYDYDRIRKIDLSVTPNTINTVIGGGALITDNVDPLDVSFTTMSAYEFSYMIFTPLPNGDIFFQSDKYFTSPALGYRVRYYTKSTNKVTSFYPGGAGHNADNTADLTNCNFKKPNITFNTTTSAVTSANVIAYCSGAYYGVSLDTTTFQSVGNTAIHPAAVVNWNGARAGMDGNSYLVNKVSGALYKFNTATTVWDKIAGTTSVGRCADGNLATSCKVHPYDSFVDALGKIHFLDRGKIRYIDSSGNLQTLMGQSGDYGDGLNATNARFGKVFVFRHWNDAGTDKFVMLDHFESRMREFPYEGVISTIAGNGSTAIPSKSADASSEPIYVQGAGAYWLGFAIDQTSGNIFMNSSNRTVGYINRATNRWIDVIGGGATMYYNGDAMTGNNITNDYGYSPIVMAQADNKLVVGWTNYQAGVGLKDMNYKIYDQTTSYTQTHLVGSSGYSNSVCANGTALNACSVMRPTDGAVSITWDSVQSQWLFLDTYTGNINNLKIGNITDTFMTSAQGILAFTYRAGNDTTYYCNAADGKLYKKTGAGAETVFDWPIPSLKCNGRSMHYHSGRDSLFFIYEQNGLYGLAEYLSP